MPHLLIFLFSTLIFAEIGKIEKQTTVQRFWWILVPSWVAFSISWGIVSDLGSHDVSFFSNMSAYKWKHYRQDETTGPPKWGDGKSSFGALLISSSHIVHRS